ncbi:Txe/YoeB family addiction module toxin [Devosia sp. XJ19-1]|uniref:Putative mRNA interferase YoeB n=1 Tax=Devosia ureilytica TaxID=2952754 RepID=A0A9Q4AR78_9HYPH|nr:Txe/YoeB family addiction module toxin [Devosia ureilytica]MCP8884749.1 Txe/YoeB family addiction module toxin [Devosia ureilytica]MCP8888380.1 Txe/YoeB family addiction module toxin [Devosia ureilytica]
MIVAFMTKGWEDYLHWQATDKQILRKVNALIKECQRTPREGSGKPEALKHEFAGWWSRRITDEHRLVYRVVGERLEIAQCRHHY